MVPYHYRCRKNNDGMTPEDAFRESHKELKKEAETWMRGAVSSWLTVAALIFTITYYSVCGVFLREFGHTVQKENWLFSFFLFTVTVCFCSSGFSLLTFLGILLTSQYADEDFLKTLPRMLILGISTLYVAITTMMLAVPASVFLMLKQGLTPSLASVFLLMTLAGVLPKHLSAMQFPPLQSMVLAFSTGMSNHGHEIT